VSDRDATPSVRRFWPESEEMGAVLAVTTRHGGVSAAPYDTLNLSFRVGDRPGDVATNRTRAAAAFGVPLGTLVFADQVHGRGVADVGPSDAGRGVGEDDDPLPASDALVTATPAVTLVILVADCLPFALVDPAAHVLAAVHAGWRSAAAGIVPATLRALTARGAQPARVRAYLGPAVAPERYQVGPEVVDALAGAVAPAALQAAVARPDDGAPGRARVDLVAAVRQQLLAAGVHADHVFESGATTADPSFFSDRAARPCGRFALLARLMS
jgi:polyphenol oxidase